MTNGHYEEQLADGGKLRVFSNHWEIEYYFQGPDLRYNGTLVKFGGPDIPKLVEDYRAAYHRYQDLKGSLVRGGDLTLNVTADLTIRVGGRFDGICLANYHDPVNSDLCLDRKLNSYSIAMERAQTIQQMLRQV